MLYMLLTLSKKFPSCDFSVAIIPKLTHVYQMIDNFETLSFDVIYVL